MAEEITLVEAMQIVFACIAELKQRIEALEATVLTKRDVGLGQDEIYDEG